MARLFLTSYLLMSRPHRLTWTIAVVKTSFSLSRADNMYTTLISSYLLYKLKHSGLYKAQLHNFSFFFPFFFFKYSHDFIYENKSMKGFSFKMQFESFLFLFLFFVYFFQKEQICKWKTIAIFNKNAILLSTCKGLKVSKYTFYNKFQFSKKNNLFLICCE